MKNIAQWLVALVFMLIVVVCWSTLFVVMSPVVLPIYLISKVKPTATILGVTLNFKGWAYQMFIAQDQTTNTVLGGNMDTHVSGRVGYHAKRGNGIALKMELVIDYCFEKVLKQVGHCRVAIENDEKYSKVWGE